MKILLLGSPSIAVPAFEEIIKNFDVVAIVTQPDKAQGRGMNVASTPVAQLAKIYKIKTFKPKKIVQIKEELKQLKFDLILSFAFGQWIPDSILQLSVLPPLNIHGSLLPKYRGAAPIHHAIFNNDKKIGITLIKMIKKMDAGKMYFKADININEETTTGDAFEIVKNLAKNNIVQWLHSFETKKIFGEKQSNDFTLAPKIQKSFCQISTSLTLNQAKRIIKTCNPLPGAFLFISKKRLKIFDIKKDFKEGYYQIIFADKIGYASDFQWENKKRQLINN